MCGKVDIGCHIRENLQTVVTNQFDTLAAKIGETAASGLQAVATFWIKIDSPTLSTEDGSGNWTDSGPVAYLHGHVMAVSATIFTLAILVAGMRIAWEQRAEPLRELLKATMLFVIVAGAGSATLQILSAWSDKFALDVVQQATKGQEFDQALGGLLLQGAASNAPAQNLPLLVAMFFGIAVFMAAVIQVVLLLIRSAMLVLLAGTFPLAAAATNTEVGKAWFRKYCAWALAFIAYKPAAALVYAAAMKMNDAGMINKSGNGLVQALTGLMMMLLAVFALPALLRFAVPVTAAVAGGSSGMGSSVADPGGVASGAVNVGRSAFGRSSGGGSSSGGGGGGGGGGRATGAIGVGASAGLAAAGAAVNGAKKAGGALAGAAAHSAGEPGGGSPSAASGGSGGGWGSRRSSSGRSNTPNDRTPEPVGPTGSG